jgi:two-component system LytT family sensor kinase
LPAQKPQVLLLLGKLEVSGSKMRVILKHKVVTHLLFWLAFYLLYIKLGLAIAPDWAAVTVIYLGKLAIQAIAAYVLVYLLLPSLLYKKKYIEFGVAVLLWTYVVYSLLIISRAFYLEPEYISFFKHSKRHLVEIAQPTVERLTNFTAYLDAVPWLFTPAAFMGLAKFYRSQLTISRVEEEKRRMELALLKNQLNPHFLFNTLNNLYTLALIKDDRAPEAIAKLSEILDFVLYKCKDDYSDLDDTISLLNNFILLEKLRYGPDRLKIDFSYNSNGNHKVAPLMLLTLVENAFKHGVTNETEQAYINIDLRAEKDMVHFKIKNTKPVHTQSAYASGKIGLKNITQQLALQYPSKHEISIDNKPETFMVNLKLYV